MASLITLNVSILIVDYLSIFQKTHEVIYFVYFTIKDNYSDIIIYLTN